MAVVKQISVWSYHMAHAQDIRTRLWSVNRRVICPVDRSTTLDTAASTVLGSLLFSRERPSTSMSSTSRWRLATMTSWRQPMTPASRTCRPPATTNTATCTPPCASWQVKVKVKVTTRWRSVPVTGENNWSIRQCRTRSMSDCRRSFLMTRPPTFCSDMSVISSFSRLISNMLSYPPVGDWNCGSGAYALSCNLYVYSNNGNRWFWSVADMDRTVFA